MFLLKAWAFFFNGLRGALRRRVSGCQLMKDLTWVGSAHLQLRQHLSIYLCLLYTLHHLYTLVGNPWAFSRLNSPNSLTLTLHVTYFKHFITLMPFTGLTTVSSCLSHPEEPSTGLRSPAISHQSWTEDKDYFHQLAANIFPNQARMLVFAVRALCWSMVNGLSTRILMSFPERYFSSCLAPCLSWCIGLFLGCYRTSNFPMLNSIRVILAHFSSISWTWTWGFWRLVLAVKSEAKKALCTLTSSVLWDQIPIPIQWYTHTFPNLSFAQDACVETLSAFLSITEFNCSWILSFLALYLGAWAVSLYFSCFLLLYIFFSRMSFVRSFVLIHADLLAWFVCWYGLTVLEFGKRNWENQPSLSDRIPDLQWYYHTFLQD